MVVSDDVDLNSVAAIPGMGIPEQLKAAMEQEQSSKSNPRTARNSQQVSRVQRKKARKFQTFFSTQIQKAERKQEEQSERLVQSHLYRHKSRCPINIQNSLISSTTPRLLEYSGFLLFGH